MRVVIAYDGSETADAAVRAAAMLWPGAAATVACVSESQVAIGALGPTVDPGLVQALQGSAQEAAQAHAAAGVALAAEHGLQARPAFPTSGEGVAGGLVALADELDADVIVSGTRGRGRAARALLGSVAARLLYDGDRPTLVVPDGAVLGEGRALVGYDGSDGADAAITTAARLLPRPLRIAYAWSSALHPGIPGQPFGDGFAGDMTGMVTELDGWMVEQAEATAERGADAARAAGAEADAVVVDGRPGTVGALREAWADDDVALLVVGPRGHGMAASALLGSVSARLLHNAEKPILLARG